MPRKQPSIEEHRKGLELLYGNLLNEAVDGGFNRNLYKSALNRLSSGVHPKKVEQWVVDMEKLWRQL